MQIPFLATVIFILGLAQAEDSIVGGHPVSIEDFPYQASLQSYGSHACGASIISANRVLTAAQCTDGISPSALSVRVGSSFRGYGGQVIPVSRIVQHPGYNPRTMDNDVSVLILPRNIVIGDGVRPIRLPREGEELDTNSTGIITGWGALSSDGNLPRQLQEAKVFKTSHEKCQEAYGDRTITSSMMCYAAPGKDSCRGDSGGPVVSYGVQFGITSWGNSCARDGYPGVYTKISDPVIYNLISIA